MILYFIECLLELLSYLSILFPEHSTSGCVTFTGLDGETGEVVEIGEWIFQSGPKNDLNSLQKQISSVEQELIYILKLRHSNLGLYYAMKFQIEDECVVVDLLREFIPGKFGTQINK